MINVTKTYLPDRAKLDRLIDRIYRSGWLTNNGELLQELEQKLAKMLGVEHLLLVTNGTLALQVAYRTLDLSGEVITTPFSFAATTGSLEWEGLQPRFADIDPLSFNMDPQRIEALITDRTSAIVPVHVFGNACDTDAIGQIAEKHGLKVIYDAAHAFSVGSAAGSLLLRGDASILSFHATKIFHTIEGGAIIFRRKADYEKARLLINFGIGGYDRIDSPGINAKMNEFQAAMGLAVLEDMETILAARQKVWERYQRQLSGREGLTLQQRNSDYSNNFAYFPIVLRSEEQLLQLRDQLQQKDIFPRRYFYPSLNTLPWLSGAEACPLSESLASRILCLPLYPDLPEAMQQEIINTILTHIA